jgi:hypothetical protein
MPNASPKTLANRKWLQTANGIAGAKARLNKRSNDAKSAALKRFRNSKEYQTLTKPEKQEQTDAIALRYTEKFKHDMKKAWSVWRRMSGGERERLRHVKWEKRLNDYNTDEEPDDDGEDGEDGEEEEEGDYGEENEDEEDEGEEDEEEECAWFTEKKIDPYRFSDEEGIPMVSKSSSEL